MTNRHPISGFIIPPKTNSMNSWNIMKKLALSSLLWITMSLLKKSSNSKCLTAIWRSLIVIMTSNQWISFVKARESALCLCSLGCCLGLRPLLNWFQANRSKRFTLWTRLEKWGFGLNQAVWSYQSTSKLSDTSIAKKSRMQSWIRRCYWIKRMLWRMRMFWMRLWRDCKARWRQN